MIFDIQRCSVHDGNGLRTLVFLKGCPLRCLWCANPESQLYECDLMQFSNRCIDCGKCIKICAKDAISRIDGEFQINRQLCEKCFRCTEQCYAESIRKVGKEYAVEELFVEIEKERPFYKLYGGGVTFSGGEPLTHVDFLMKTAKRCHDSGINVVLESCGYGEFDGFKKILPYVDYMFIDIKHIDSNMHKKLTGKGNELILDNVKRIAEFGVPITIRTPIIPNYNQTIENVTGIATYISDIQGVKEYELLPYHNLGESKYKALGRGYALKGTALPQDEDIRNLVKVANHVLNKRGKECFYMKDNRREIVA